MLAWGYVEYDSRKSIMIVDDEADVALSLKLILESSGYRVDTFTDPINAISSYRVGCYALVLLDVKMPRMNGFELYRKLRKIDNSFKICFITAFEAYYKSLKEFFPALDVSCFIQKPVSQKRLLQLIDRETKYK